MVNKQFATAVHVMTSLAFQKNLKNSPHMNSEQLAESVNTNPVVIRRLLSSLTKATLVVTSRGKSGGVQLAKEPHQITLKDIYAALALNETIAPHNKSPKKECPVSCSMHAIMSNVADGAHKATLKYLESQKLSDLIKKIKAQA